ncbi:MAG: bifunctional methylenetetrahydrofolate dehydrogenase/methenyltetrahydrofolate cyclohydrolase FolD [Beijerinckiaceae bacterium]|nr:bifunctional methylenetetrahydrofolate dehydrogenase/methenyltetrahydrofolate cyclohydrolase FolD [Beijerinckiaceae bacterium]
MTATLIDGKQIAEALRREIAQSVAELKDRHNVTPALAVVLVGDDPASQVYVRSKLKQTVEAGMRSIEYVLPGTIAQSDLVACIRTLNADHDVDGILVQLPLPGHIDADAVIAELDPAKDVDGLSDLNAGRLASGKSGLLSGIVPCTPLGSLMLVKSVRQDLSGLEAVIIGRSNLFGKPMAQLLLQESCTVTIAHSRTADLPAVCRRADILIAAVGRAEMVKSDWLKPQAIVIDVGINRISLPEGKTKLVGDVDFAAARLHAQAITPVPGGVGPMTLACLLGNTLKAARLRRRLDV